MVKKILFITDYLENENEIASIRLKYLLNSLNENYEIKFVSFDRKGIKDSNFKEQSYIVRKNTIKILNYLPRKISNRIINILEKIIFNHSKLRNRYHRHDIDVITNLAKDADTIFVTVPGSHLSVILKDALKKINISQVQLVTEFRDPLVNNIRKPNKVDIEAEHFLLEHSKQFIFLTEGIKEKYLATIKRVNNNDFCYEVITNGYDPKFVKESVRLERPENFAIITHTGTLYDSRNPLPLLKALNQYTGSHKKNIELNLVGKKSLYINKTIDLMKFNYRNNDYLKINNINKVPEHEAQEYILKSDICVVITHQSGSEYAIPGKVFEYAAFQKKILALTSDITLINFLKNEKVGTSIPNNQDEIIRNLNSIFSFRVQPEDYKAFLNNYNRIFISKKIEKFLSNKEN